MKLGEDANQIALIEAFAGRSEGFDDHAHTAGLRVTATAGSCQAARRRDPTRSQKDHDDEDDNVAWPENTEQKAEKGDP